jgi:citrate synthase
MTMLSMAILYLQHHSEFVKAYHYGVPKSRFWEYYYEDAMNIIAKLPIICAYIYRHKYKSSKLI